MKRRSAFAALRIFVAAAAVGLACDASAQDAPRTPPARRILIDRSLRETDARIVKLDSASVVFTGADEPADAPPRSRPCSELLAIISAPDTGPKKAPTADEPAGTVRVVRTDGQRIVGRLEASASNEEVRVAHHLIGVIAIPLDDVLRVEAVDPESSQSDRTEPAQGADDVVELVNGDVLRGYVETIGPSVSIKTQGASDPTAIEFNRVLRVRLANTPKPATGLRLWLADGSCIEAKSLGQWSQGSVGATLAAGGLSLSVDLSSLTAVCFDSARVVALAGITTLEFHPSPDRRWTRAPVATSSPDAPMGAARILLPGPMMVDWPLASRATAFGTWVELAPATESWGDCTVTVAAVSADGAESVLATRRLSSESPRTRIEGSIAPGAARLRVKVESGPRGPILDRVTLDRALLLLAPK